MIRWSAILIAVTWPWVAAMTASFARAEPAPTSCADEGSIWRALKETSAAEEAFFSHASAAQSDRGFPGPNAVDLLLHRCPELRAVAINRLAASVAAAVRAGSYDGTTGTDAVSVLPYRDDAWREITRTAAVLLEAGRAVPGSCVYCRPASTPTNMARCAGAPAANGDLRLGFITWDPWGKDLTLFGTASRAGAGWIFRDRSDSANPDYRCRIRIVRDADGALHVSSLPHETCGSEPADGTPAMEIGRLDWPSRDLEGPATWQLDSERVLEDLATECRQ